MTISVPFLFCCLVSFSISSIISSTWSLRDFITARATLNSCFNLTMSSSVGSNCKHNIHIVNTSCMNQIHHGMNQIHHASTKYIMHQPNTCTSCINQIHVHHASTKYKDIKSIIFDLNVMPNSSHALTEYCLIHTAHYIK